MVKITDVTGIGPVAAKVLSEHNIKTVEALASISLVDLKKIPGFSDRRAPAIKKAASDCLQKAAKQSAISAKNTQAPVKKAPIKKPAVKKAAPVAQQAMDPIVTGKAESKKKDKVKEKVKTKDQDKKKKGKNKDKKKSGKKKDKGKK